MRLVSDHERNPTNHTVCIVTSGWASNTSPTSINATSSRESTITSIPALYGALCQMCVEAQSFNRFIRLIDRCRRTHSNPGYFRGETRSASFVYHLATQPLVIESGSWHCISVSSGPRLTLSTCRRNPQVSKNLEHVKTTPRNKSYDGFTSPWPFQTFHDTLASMLNRSEWPGSRHSSKAIDTKLEFGVGSRSARVSHFPGIMQGSGSKIGYSRGEGISQNLGRRRRLFQVELCWVLSQIS